MVTLLLENIAAYKVDMEFKGLDFDADRHLQYKYVRENLARKFSDNSNFFGVESMDKIDFKGKSEVEIKKMKQEIKDGMKRGHDRVLEKTKEIRKKFSTAVIAGTRSGSGKFVYENYDILVQIYGGSASAQPLDFGVCTSEVNAEESSSPNDQPESNPQEDPQEDIQTPTSSSCAPASTDVIEETPLRGGSNGKRKASDKTIKLVDNKRKHMERELSAAQRDKLLIDEAKEEKQFKKDMAQAMRDSMVSFDKSLERFSNVMLQSFSMLAAAINPQQQQSSSTSLHHNHSHHGHRASDYEFGRSGQFSPSSVHHNQPHQGPTASNYEFGRVASHSAQAPPPMHQVLPQTNASSYSFELIENEEENTETSYQNI